MEGWWRGGSSAVVWVGNRLGRGKRGSGICMIRHCRRGHGDGVEMTCGVKGLEGSLAALITIQDLVQRSGSCRWDGRLYF
jgi:hypothetical protein